MDWSRLEVELVVADYFAMLWKELAGQPVDKTAHRKALQPQLNGRSHGSIEFKHQNISAVLINFDQSGPQSRSAPGDGVRRCTGVDGGAAGTWTGATWRRQSSDAPEAWCGLCATGRTQP